MAESVTFNNAVYIIPDVGESNWGQNLTNFFVAIPSGCYQLSGGTNPLTADLSFGTNFGLFAKYLTSTTATPATAGSVRLAKTDAIEWRNNANGGNLALTINASDQLTFNGNIIPTDTAAITAKSFLYGDAAGLLASTANPTNGQLLIGSTGSIPAVAALTGTASQVVVTNGAGTITLSLPQNIATTSTPTFASETLTAVTNQLVLGTTNTTTISSTAPASSRTYTIPDAGGAANVVLDAGNYTIAGTWTFNNALTIKPTTNQLVLGTTRTITLSATQPATSSRVYTFPDAGAAANVVLDQGAYTIAANWIFSSGTNTALSIGAAAPNTGATPPFLAIVNDNSATNESLRFYSYGASVAAANVIHYYRANGTAASPTAVLSGDTLSSTGWRGYANGTYTNSALALECVATENWTGVATGCYFEFQATPTGSGSRIPVLRIAGTGPVIFTGPLTLATGVNLVMGNSGTATTFVASGANTTITIPNSGTGSSNMVLDQGAYTIAGAWTFNSTITMGATIAMGSHKITSLTNGSVASDAAAYGQLKVLQTVTAVSNTGFTTTSGTFQSTNLTATITPTSASNRILILVSGTLSDAVPASADGILTIFRGVTNLGAGAVNGMLILEGTSATTLTTGVGVNYVDSPATTSPTTYTVKISNDAGAVTIGFGTAGTTQSMTLIEVV